MWGTYEKHASDGRGTDNSRNGKTLNRVIDGDSEIEIAVPRDRNGDFQPQLVRKRQARLPGFDEKVLWLYGCGTTTCEI
ncbi:MAG: transposase [Krumholzibacteria bacterium]|nr:transposase [Candidatus Krumholzibacteria bacterium]